MSPTLRCSTPSAFVAMISVIAGCYQPPSLASCKYRCGGVNNNACPDGYSCNAGMCVAPGEGCDGDGGVIDAPPGDGEMVSDGLIDGRQPACLDPTQFTWVRTSTLMTMPALAQVVALDTNNDGKLDIAVLDEADRVGVFLGNGDGTFGNRVASQAGSSARRMIAGDFDHDTQKDDLVVMNGTPSTNISVMKSQGGGVFQRMGFGLGGNPIDIAKIGDIDGNTFEDFVVLDVEASNPRLRVFQQITSGSFFMAGTTVATNVSGTSINAGFLDGGSVMDAVVTITESNQVGIHLGNNTQMNWAFDAIDTESISGSPVDAAIGLLRSSGTPSVVFANTDGNNVSIRHSTSTPGMYGDGGSLAVGTAPTSVILANVGGNSLPDIITTNGGGNSISVLVNQDGGNFADAQDMTVDSTPIEVVSGDFDNDQRIDLAVASSGMSTVTILLNKCP